MDWNSGTGLANYGSNHCFLNSAVQALFHLTTDVDLEYEWFNNRIGGELLSLFKRMNTRTGTTSVSHLRYSLSNEFSSSGIFNYREFGDSYQAFCAILQVLFKDNPESKIVKQFQHKVYESAFCDCTPVKSNPWNEDCFGLSLQVKSGHKLEQSLEEHQRKRVKMCMRSGGTCFSSTIFLQFYELPQVLVLHCNSESADNLYYSYYQHRSSRIEIPLQLSSRIFSRELLGVKYELEGAIFVTPGHFYSGFKTKHYWTIFNDSQTHKLRSFAELHNMTNYAEPYLLFYKKVENSPATIYKSVPSMQSSMRSSSSEIDHRLTNVIAIIQLLASSAKSQVVSLEQSCNLPLFKALLQTLQDPNSHCELSQYENLGLPEKCFRSRAEVHNAILSIIKKVLEELTAAFTL